MGKHLNPRKLKPSLCDCGNEKERTAIECDGCREMRWTTGIVRSESRLDLHRGFDRKA